MRPPYTPRLTTHIVLLLSISAWMAACEATERGDGTSGDGVDLSPGIDTESSHLYSPDLEEPIDYCSYQRWTGPNVPLEQYECTSTEQGDDYECDCNGVSVIHAADECEQALREACALEDTEPTYCQRPNGVCWLEAPDTYSCRCEGDDTLVPGTSTSCEDLLFTTCTASCADGWGSCTPTEPAGVFTCQCTYFATPAFDMGSSKCEAILARCNPSKTHWSGICVEMSTGYDCYCADGSSTTLYFSDLGHDDIEIALDLACPPVDPPDGYYCTETGASYEIECVREQPDASTFACTCTSTGATWASTGLTPITADDCDAALAAVSCP